ncbi:ImuA family protein [Azospirillum sp. ST 5-10]|uniref:ImuA family protein n=1 Tax=unclassified Azospirillum TaxID=2630922 RepID=UPI003F49F81D
MPARPSAPVPAPARGAALGALRARIRRLEGIGGVAEGRALPLGLADLDAALPDGGLPLGCLHEVAAADPGAGTAFAAVLLARLVAVGRGPAVWIVRGRDLHAPGLAAYGLGPERLIAVRARRDAEALWAMEEALRCRALAAVLGEVGTVDLTASRRLQLAAEAGGVTGLLLPRDARPGAASAAVTRWRIAAVPSVCRPGEPGVGAPCWRAELLRCRGGRPGAWWLEWRDGALVAAEAAAGAAVPDAVPAGTVLPLARRA